ncbi:hypothetical protein [Halobacillus sp. H74]|uniref:hypothetical protein n=1 Tax=Halobacillus sp. H74 TaxID=3457436 RepID=UPI003FCE6E3C
MSNYQAGQLIQKRCMECFHNEMIILKVTEKDLKEKSAYILWIQCPECGTNDSELTPEDL